MSKKNITYRPGIYNLQTRTSTFQDQEKLLEKVYLRYLKTLKTKKLNTKNPKIKHCPCSKCMMIYRPDLRTWCTIYRPEKTAKKVTKTWNWLFLISQLLKISNINTDHESKMVWNKRHNLQTRIVPFADQKKYWIGTNSTNRNLDRHFSHVTKSRIFKNLNLIKKTDRNFCGTFLKKEIYQLKRLAWV